MHRFGSRNSLDINPAGLTLVTDVCYAQDEVSSLKGKLDECKAQLQSNEQMIRWLNNQVGNITSAVLLHAVYLRTGVCSESHGIQWLLS